jgi:hypothetical protein
LGILKERDHFGDIRADGRIILKWLLNKEDMKMWT